MPTKEVIINQKYRHNDTGEVLQLESASVPYLDNSVSLRTPGDLLVNKGFFRVWRGTWEEFFFKEWTTDE